MTPSRRPPSRSTLTTHGTGHPRLHLVHGGHLFAGTTELGVFNLRTSRTVIGSGVDVDLQVPGLETRHAEIRRTEHDEYEVVVLSGPVSVNGVNAAPGSSIALHSGDLLRCRTWAASFGRDESTDHTPQRSQSYPPGPRGLLQRWNRLVFLVYGTSDRAPLHRNAPRPPDPATQTHHREDTP